MAKNLAQSNFSALIVEDDPKLATIFSTALQQANYKTEIMQDGRLALQYLAVSLPDIVILDLHLPFVSGADVLKQIRADQRLARTQVIIVTADLFRAEALRDQVDAILFKPVGFIRLQNLVAKLQASQIARFVE